MNVGKEWVVHLGGAMEVSLLTGMVRAVDTKCQLCPFGSRRRRNDKDQKSTVIRTLIDEIYEEHRNFMTWQAEMDGG